MPRIYLDNAATSWPKPEAVYEAMDDYQRRLGAPAGRSAYREAGEVERLVDGARRAVAQLIGAPDPNRIIFTLNGTDALNLAIHGLLCQGDHVITTVAEHNSVLRPLRNLEQAAGCQVTRVGVSGEGIFDPDDIRRAIRPNTELIVVNAASNVTGALQPVAKIGSIAQGASVRFLVDAAQAIGHIPIDVREWKCDLLAAPGHKGLLGPLGTGILYVGLGVESDLRSVRQGGTGSRSHEDIQPDSLPDKYECGNLNVPGILGLRAGVEYLLKRGMADIREHDLMLTERLLAGLAAISNIRVLGPKSASERVGVVSITIDGYDPQEAAAALDAAHYIQVRAGLHCAPLMHQALGTLETGGTLRFSIGPFNTPADIDAAVAAVKDLVTHG